MLIIHGNVYSYIGSISGYDWYNQTQNQVQNIYFILIYYELDLQSK